MPRFARALVPALAATLAGSRPAVRPAAAQVPATPSTAPSTVVVRGARLLDDLIDAHTRVLLRGDVTAEEYDAQLSKESIPYRTIRATRAVAPTRTYAPSGYAPDALMPESVQIVDGVDAALRAGFTTIEHGAGMTDDLLDRLVRQGACWCPTISAMDSVAEGRGGVWREMPRLARAAVARGVLKGARIANGRDAGGYAWTEPMAREIVDLASAGMTPTQAVRAATGVAAELLARPETGALAPGRYADLVAAPGDASR